MGEPCFVGPDDHSASFPLLHEGKTAPILVDESDWIGVIRAAKDLQADFERVGGEKPEMLNVPAARPDVIIVGTLGHSGIIDRLASEKKIDAAAIAGKWEAFLLQIVENPVDGIDRALVIAGSDKRGSIYGIYELSEQIGVSPWYWWADVPVKQSSNLFASLPEPLINTGPVVKYRGIFLNDEAPCLSGWTDEKFGGMNHKFYTKLFELMLRMRANYLWPAMWNNAFNTDDPENPRLADEYGIIMGTSHHEPMMRAHKEWTDHCGEYGNGQWNYATNSEALQRFFREGIARNGKYDNLITIGMRGDGDVGMVSTGSMESDIAQIKKIMTDQRQIIAEEMQTDPAKVPQLWALFTEVQKYYEAGLRPPDDVTLLWCDDNNGMLRRLPTAEERKRSGGAGIYYHIDMHGGPFAYQWVNTNPLPKIAEQFHLATEYGANRIWIINVGDMKPLEIPIEFIMRMAWNPAKMTKDDVAEWTRRWAERDFGPEHAAEIADIVSRYGKFNGWRKPELVTPDTYSQINYCEAERVEKAWADVTADAEAMYKILPANARDAFYELVLHPAKASATVAEMNIAAGRNHLYARQGRASTNATAGQVRALFQLDRDMTNYYNHTLADGKWNHLMDQTHLGQYSWEPPRVNSMPAVSEILPADDDRYGVAIEGDISAWPEHYGDAVLPVFDSLNPRRSYVEVFADGTQPIDFMISADKPWIKISEDATPRLDRRFWVDIDWAQVPAGSSSGMILVKGKRQPVVIRVPVRKADDQQLEKARGRFASLDGPIAIDPTKTAKRTEVNGVRWEEIPDYGRVKAALAIYPVTAASILPPNPAPTLEYPIYLPRAGTYEVTLILGPVMDFVPDRGMRIAVAFDDEKAETLDVFADRTSGTFLGNNWYIAAQDNARHLSGSFKLDAAGPHTLKISMVDPGLVLQKIILSDKPVPVSYFGPTDNLPVK